MEYSDPCTVFRRGSVLGRFFLVGRDVGSSSVISSCSPVGMVAVLLCEMHFSFLVIEGFWSIFRLPYF